MLNLTDSQEVILSIAPIDSRSNPAVVDGEPSWSSSDVSVVTVTPAAGGLSASVVALGKIGSAQITVSADADLGSGVSPITGTLDITVISGLATSLSITAGAPTEQR